MDTTANARVVETFLYALQDEDFDTAEARMADNIVWQNVGYPHHARPEAHHAICSGAVRDAWASR